jgi:Mlc titration factor MtfA (ptsG expression regulator)
MLFLSGCVKAPDDFARCFAVNHYHSVFEFHLRRQSAFDLLQKTEPGHQFDQLNPSLNGVQSLRHRYRQAWSHKEYETAMCVQDIDDQCVLQITLIHAVCCALHRLASQVLLWTIVSVKRT